MRSRSVSLFVIAALVVLLAQPALAGPIAVTNPSFQSGYGLLLRWGWLHNSTRKFGPHHGSGMDICFI